MDSAKVFAMKFSKVYPLYVAKAEKKGRTRAEVDAVISWLTGYDGQNIASCVEQDIDIGTFFFEAPCINPNCHLIRGTVCGVRVEEIQDPLMQTLRYLDKLIDELAGGKPMEKILRE